MNYYELYGFEPGFLIDGSLLKQRYYELSRRYHPDFYRPAPGEPEDALELASAVNKGYALFQNPEQTIFYMLQLKGLVQDDEKYALPPAFLAEVMDLNERVMELEMEPDAATLARCAAQTRQLIQENQAAVQPILNGYRSGITPGDELLKVKDYYYRNKYLQRILDKLEGMEKAGA